MKYIQTSSTLIFIQERIIMEKIEHILERIFEIRSKFSYVYNNNQFKEFISYPIKMYNDFTYYYKYIERNFGIHYILAINEISETVILYSLYDKGFGNSYTLKMNKGEFYNFCNKTLNINNVVIDDPYQGKGFNFIIDGFGWLCMHNEIVEDCLNILKHSAISNSKQDEVYDYYINYHRKDLTNA